MRLGPDDKFWLVLDPTPLSTLADILFETTLRGLELQFKGGLTAAENPMIFTDKAEAEREAHGRLLTLLAAGALGRQIALGKVVTEAHRVVLLDGQGAVVLEAELG